MLVRVSVNATVSPSNPPAEPLLDAGQHSITITAIRGENDGLIDAEGNPAISEHQEVTCEYPDGFTKNHQVASQEDLYSRIATVLRNQYGIAEFTFSNTITLDVGQQIMIEV
jgi:hypothetical protein